MRSRIVILLSSVVLIAVINVPLARALYLSEVLCEPQVVFSSDETKYVALKQCEGSDCIIKFLGKMADGKNFKGDYYKHSGDFYGPLFSGDVPQYNTDNDVKSLHCASGDAADSQFFLCVGANPIANIPPNAMIRIRVPWKPDCAFTPKLVLKDDANGDNVPDGEEGAPPVVDLGVLEDQEDDGGGAGGSSSPGTATPDQPTLPATGSVYDEGSGCGICPTALANPVGLILISMGVAVLAIKRRS